MLCFSSSPNDRKASQRGATPPCLFSTRPVCMIEEMGDSWLASNNNSSSSSNSSSNSSSSSSNSSSKDNVIRLDGTSTTSPPPKQTSKCASSLSNHRATFQDCKNVTATASFSSSSDEEDWLLAQGPTFSKSLLTTRPTRKRNATTHPTTSRMARTSSSTLSTTTSSSTTSQQRQRRTKEERQAKEDHKRNNRQLEKEQEKQERQAQKLVVQQLKQTRIQQAQQTMGKFASSEVAVLIEPNALGAEHHATIKEGLEESSYSVQEYDYDRCNNNNRGGGATIQWIRKDYTAGGATGAWNALQRSDRQGFQHLDLLVIVFDDPTTFLNLLERNEETHDNDDDYPRLQQYTNTLISSWQSHWKMSKDDNVTIRQPRVVLMLYQVMDQLSKQWNAYRSKSKSRKQTQTTLGGALPVVHLAKPPSDVELHDAIVFLLVQLQVECILCDDMEHIVGHLKRMTRALSEVPYQQQVTELECIRKIKSSFAANDNDNDNHPSGTEGTNKENSNNSNNADDVNNDLRKAKDCWTRQLQMVPGISETKALSLVEHYPTARSLWDAYQDPNLTESQKCMLVADLLSDRSQQRKISDSLFRLMTGTNGEELL